MKLVICGASGFLGCQLIPRLKGCQLLLVGRDTARLHQLFPEHDSCRYEDWENQADGADAVINLAVINNNQTASWQEVEQVNVDLPCALAQGMQRQGIKQLIQISSVHALDTHNASNYARSKRLATEKLAQFYQLSLTTIYLPMVWGESWPHSLRFLNQLPETMAKALFRPLAALKPTVHVDTLLAALLEALEQQPAERVVCDDIGMNRWYQALSAVIDYGFALSILLFFWWLLALLAIWVRSTSPGPGIFAQTRVGQNGTPFTCYKFRTMKAGTQHAGTHEVSAASVTPVGAFLRRTKLDELPQIWNILRGELRLVGPRPGLPVQQELFEARYAAGVYDIKPGITGWAQIHDIDMSDPQRLAIWDARYIAMRGLLLDIRIILATAFGHGQGDRTADTKD